MVLTTTWSIQSHGITARFTCPLTTQDTISNQLRSATETYILFAVTKKTNDYLHIWN